jgi:DNA-binding NarL/FixJ family response regulator
MGAIAVVLIDNDATLRRGLYQLLALEPDIQVVEACGEREALSAVARHRPDVVLVTSPSVSLVEALHRASPHSRIVGRLPGLTPDVQAAFRGAGGHCALERLCPVGMLLEAIRRCGDGSPRLRPTGSEGAVPQTDMA